MTEKPTASDNPEDPEDIDDPVTPGQTPKLLQARQLYTFKLAKMSLDERLALARTAQDPELAALCFDPHPSIVEAMMENSALRIYHVRAIVDHHANSNGLDALRKRSEMLHDGRVQLRLLRNPNTSQKLLDLILAFKPLIQLYTHCISPEIHEKSRKCAQQAFLHRFQRVSPEEKANFLIQNEARCLRLLQGPCVDSQTVVLLSRRSISSFAIIQNFAQWPSTPPNLIRHLLQQKCIQSGSPLHQMLTRHPNCPGDVRRAIAVHSTRKGPLH